MLIFSVNNGRFETVLIQRVREPFKGMWSAPGDIIDIHESLDEAAQRILLEKTGIKNVYLEQLYTFGNPKRDKRGRVITVAYFALIPHKSVDLSQAPNALHASWFPVGHLPTMAFDHKKIVKYAVERIRAKIGYSTIAHGLVPEKFRLSELQKVYELILKQSIDKRNFVKRLKNFGLVEPTGEIDRTGHHRPAKLYKFTSKELVIFR